MSAIAPRAGWRGLIVGHRGAAGLAPENTLASFEAAVAAGADAVELDVRRTSDGKAVVFHDLTLDRFVPDARGRSVPRHTLAEMKGVDVGLALGRPGCFVPSLDDVLDALSGRVHLEVEVKGSGADGAITVPLCVEALRARGMGDQAVLSSFHEPVVRRMRDAAPDLRRALIVDERATGDVVAAGVACGCHALHPKWTMVDAALLARCREAGLLVKTWTVNDAETMARLMDLGVDGIITDVPDLAVRVAGRAASHGRA